MEKLPNFFIISAPKSGTTTLYEYFKEIPEIFMPAEKEPHFFSDDIIPYGYSRSMSKKEYFKSFDKVKDEIWIGEASTSYLRNEKAAEKIAKFNPQSKIIILLRDPVKRAISEYLWYFRTGEEKLHVNDAIKRDIENIENKSNKLSKIIDGGLYSKHIRRYFQVFDKKQIKVIIFEEFTKNIQEEVKCIMEFLGTKEIHLEHTDTVFNEYRMPRGDFSRSIVSNSLVAKFLTKIIPNSSVRRILREKLLEKKGEKPKIDEENIKWLENFYQNDIKKLEDILNVKLPWYHEKKD